jgi:hypothetical protein
MKFRTGLIVGAAIGYALGSRMSHEAEDDGHSGVIAAMARHPSAQRLGKGSRRVIDIAGDRGVQAIRKARQNLQRRLDASADDLSMN